MAGYTQIKLLIVEDEWVISRYIRDIVETHFDTIVVCDEVRTASAAIEAIRNHHPRIVLLDIEMPDGSSFDVIEQTQEIAFYKIFITSHSEHALKAIKAHALDYHLKPINEKELVASLARCLEQIEQEEIVKHSTLRGAGNPKVAKRDEEHFLVVNKKTEKILVEYGKILYVMSDNSYTNVFYLSNREVASVKTSIPIRRMEELLPGNAFFRIHNRYIVNTKYLTGINSTQANLAYGIVLPVSPEKAKLFKTRVA